MEFHGFPYLALPGADVVEGHRAMASSHRYPVAALVIAHHVEPGRNSRIQGSCRNGGNSPPEASGIQPHRLGRGLNARAIPTATPGTRAGRSKLASDPGRDGALALPRARERMIQADDPQGLATHLQMAGKHSGRPFFLSRAPSRQYMTMSMTLGTGGGLSGALRGLPEGMAPAAPGSPPPAAPRRRRASSR